jgi:hemoglobin
MTMFIDPAAWTSTMPTALDKFYEKVLADPELARYFANADIDHIKARQRDFLTAQMSRPDPVAAAPVVAKHSPLGITGHAFDLFVNYLVETLSEHQVPAPAVQVLKTALGSMRTGMVTA